MIVMSGKQSLEYVVVPTMFDRRTRASLDSLYHLQEEYPQHLWQGYIPVDTKFREASGMEKPASYLFPTSHGVKAYRILLQYLMTNPDVMMDELPRTA